jgi:cobalt-zinc-cadmium resistance protein CzcA
VFFPLFSLQDIEGKMFKPLALSIMFTMAASLLISLTVTPVLSSFFIRENEVHAENKALAAVRRIYEPVLNWALNNTKKTAVIAAVVLFVSLLGVKFIGTEFLPYLDEGAIAINVVKFPTASLDGSKEIGEKIEKMLLEFPEVETVITKTGRAEIAEDPMGPEQNDIFVMLKERKYWKAGSKKILIGMMEKKLAVLPGIRLNFSQPIALRVNELISGVKSDVAVKISGYDLQVLGKNAGEIEHALSLIKGAADVKMEQSAGLLQLDIDIDREAIARYGLNVSDVNSVVETAIGGKIVTTVFEGDKRISVQVRYPEENRATEKAIRDISVMTPAGQWLPLSQLAQISMKEVPALISRENGSRRVIVECNVRGRDIGGFVKEAKAKLSAIEKALPENYFISWGGQFENQERAMKTLAVVVPAVVLLIFLMLVTVFGSFKPAALVILNLPFAFVGGIVAVLIFRMTLSVSAVVGFIVLFGIAVQNGVVLVSFITQLRREGLSVMDAVKKGCELRLRPLLLTTLSAMVGLVPLLWASGAGADIQKPLAVVVLGGLISSWFLTLVVMPALYAWFEKEVVEY